MTEAENEMLQEIRLNVVEIAAQLKERCPAHQRRVEALETAVIGNGRDGLKARVAVNEGAIEDTKGAVVRINRRIWYAAGAAVTALAGALKAMVSG